MSTSYIDLPPRFDPAPRNPEAAIATLGMRALIELDGVLANPGTDLAKAENPWAGVVTAERSKRTRNITATQDYLPSLVESPTYDSEKGPMAYLELIRETNLANGLTKSGVNKSIPEGALINDLIRPYITPESSHPLAGSNDLFEGEMMSFFTANIKGLLLGPLSTARISYEHDKYEAIRSHVPDASIEDAAVLKYQVHRHGLKKKDLEALRMGVEDVPFRSSVPDFYQIGRIHQNDILKAITTEWTEMHTFITTIDAELLQKHSNRTQMPLAYRSFAELQLAVEQNPLVAPKEICKVFLQQPQEFEEAIHQLREVAARSQRLATQLARTTRSYMIRTPRTIESNNTTAMHEADSRAVLASIKKFENMGKVQHLINDPDVNAAVLDASAGEAIAITELDQIMPASKFDTTLDKHIELIGRALWENTEERCPDGLRLARWSALNIGELLRSKFNGNLRNLKITQSPIAKEHLRETLDSYSIEATSVDSALRLLIEAEMKPTGKKAEPALLSMLLFIRKARPGVRNQDVLCKNKAGVRTTGPEVAHILQMEARAIGRAVELTGRVRPLSAGLPSLGKNR